MSVKPASAATSAEVRKDMEQRRALYQERDIVMHNLRRYRTMRQQVKLPRGWKRYFGRGQEPRVPLIYRLVQTAVTAVTPDFPHVQEEPLSAVDKPRADEQSRALNFLLQTIDRRQQRRFLTSIYYKHMGDGMSALKTLPGRWSGYPLKDDEETDSQYNDRVERFLRDNPEPFYMSVVDPLTAYPPIDEYGEGTFVEISWRRPHKLFESLRLVTEKTSGGRMRLRQVPDGEPYPLYEFPPSSEPLVEVREAWTKDACFISCPSLGGDVWEIENELGETPYSWAYADPTGIDDPVNIGMSVAFPLYYLAPHVDTFFGLMMMWASFMAPTLFTTQAPSPYVRATQETATTNFEPGMIYNLPTGRDLKAVGAPDMGSAANQFLNAMLSLSDRAGLPAHTSGDIAGSRLPSLTLQQATDSALARLGPARRGLEFLLADGMRKARNIIADSGEDIPVNGWEMIDKDSERRTTGWAVVRADECARGRPITVTLEEDSTQDLIAKGTHAQFMEQAGLWSLRRSMKFGGARDPDEEMAEIAADVAWKQGIKAQAFKALMEDDELGEYFRMMIGAAPAGGAPTGAPPAPTPEGEGEGGGGNGNAPLATLRAMLEAEGGPGRNREGVPAGAGGGRRGGLPTERPRGNRASAYGRS